MDEMDIFWRSYHFNQYRQHFLCMRWWFSRSYKSLTYTIINFLFSFLKLLLILKMLPEALLKIPLSVIGQCSLVPTSHWLQGKCVRIYLSKAASGKASGMNLQNQRRLPVCIFSVKITALGSLKRVTGRCSKLVKEQAKTLSLIFSSNKKQKIVKTIQRMYEKYLIIIVSLQNKFSSCDTIRSFMHPTS